MVGAMRGPLYPFRSPIWRQRQFVRFWFGESVSMIGSSVTNFALPLVAVITLEVSPSQMGLLRGLGAAPGILIGLFAGVWVDRVSRKALLISTALIAAALVASIPVAYVLGPLSFGHLIAVALCFGILGPFWWPAWNAFLPSVVEPDLLFDANSKLLFSWSATGVIGPGVGGLLVQAVGAPFALLFDAGSFVVSSAVLATVRPRVEERRAEDTGGTMLAQIREGLRVTFLDPMQRAITIPRAILDFLDAFSISVIVGFVIGSLAGPGFERRFGVAGAILWGLALIGASPYTMVAANDALPDWVNVSFFALPGLIGGFGGVIQHAGYQALRQSITPERLLGRVYASASFVGRVLWLVGALAGGFVGEAVGLRPAVIVVAVGYAIPFVYALSSPLRSAREATRSRTPEPAEG